MVILVESSELIVVPFILKASRIIFPEPLAEISRLASEALVVMVLSVTVIPSSVDVPDTDSAVVVVVPDT